MTATLEAEPETIRGDGLDFLVRELDGQVAGLPKSDLIARGVVVDAFLDLRNVMTSTASSMEPGVCN